jgi:hypothetical protein
MAGVVELVAQPAGVELRQKYQVPSDKCQVGERGTRHFLLVTWH